MLEDDSEPFLFRLGLHPSGSHWLLRNSIKHDTMLVKIAILPIHVTKPNFRAVLLAREPRLFEFGTLTTCLQCNLLQRTWGLPASLGVWLFVKTFWWLRGFLLLVNILERLFRLDFLWFELYGRLEDTLLLCPELVFEQRCICRVWLLLLLCFCS